jgi:uncharacterized protein (DUF1684 family)
MATHSAPDTFRAGEALALLDWKHCIFDVYAAIRSDPDPRRAWQLWRGRRDELYRAHSQSPVAAETRGTFAGSYYEYDPAYRVLGEVVDAEPLSTDLAASTGGTFRFTRVGVVRFTLGGVDHELELDWNEGYGGGLFLAFRDGTSGETTYGGGRYLLDTVKGSDLGADRDAGTLVLDFNFAYNPSCSYDARWACPLAPLANELPVDVTAGEQAVGLGIDSEA